jgi:ATP-dependent DNA helicase RecG
VSIALQGTVDDPRLVGFLEQVGQERLATFTTGHFLAVSQVHRSQKVGKELGPALRQLFEQGIVERVSKGKYVLSRRFFSFLGKTGEYTRKKGLDRETNRMLLLKHIRDSGGEGTRMEELLQVLPALTRGQVRRLMDSLKKRGLVRSEGERRGTRWYPGSGEGDAK